MVNLDVDKNYILDLHDDFFGNYSKGLYQFIDGDPVTAFYLGMNVNEWFKDLGQERQLLYSKQLRHSGDNLSKYTKQIEFWYNKFPKDNQIDVIKLSEYILNNMFWEQDSDIINMALFLGAKSTKENN